MTRKLRSISYIVLVSMLFSGCYKENSNDDINGDTFTDEIITSVDGNTATAGESSDIAEEKNTEFNALGNTYIGNKGYEDFNANDEIVNSSNYVQNEYKEIDFAIDLVSQHLLGNVGVYDYLVSSDENGNVIPLTDNDRAHIEKDLYSFKVEQYGVYEDTPLYFNFMYAQFLGYDGDGVKLYIRGHISGLAVSYIVTVYEQGNNLVAKIL